MKATPPPADTPSPEGGESPLLRIPVLAERSCCSPCTPYEICTAYEICPPPLTTCSAIKLITRLGRRIAPFNFNITAAAGIFLWFLLFFLLGQGCRPFFACHVCENCVADCCDDRGR